MAVDLPYPEEQPPTLLTCTVLNTPASTADPLYVRVSGMGRMGVTWQPHGATLPAAGTTGLVGLDDVGHGWLLMWAGGWS